MCVSLVPEMIRYWLTRFRFLSLANTFLSCSKWLFTGSHNLDCCHWKICHFLARHHGQLMDQIADTCVKARPTQICTIWPAMTIRISQRCDARTGHQYGRLICIPIMSPNGVHHPCIGIVTLACTQAPDGTYLIFALACTQASNSTLPVRSCLRFSLLSLTCSIPFSIVLTSKQILMIAFAFPALTFSSYVSQPISSSCVNKRFPIAVRSKSARSPRSVSQEFHREMARLPRLLAEQVCEACLRMKVLRLMTNSFVWDSRL